MYPDDLMAALASLPPAKQYVFGLCCAERLLGLYPHFEAVWEQTNYAQLVAYLEGAYAHALTFDDPTFRAQAAPILAAIEAKTPHSDEYSGGIEVIFAQNVSFALAYCYEYSLAPDAALMGHAGICVLETVDALALEADEAADPDPLLDQELVLQQQYVDQLRTMELTVPALTALRTVNRRHQLLFAP